MLFIVFFVDITAQMKPTSLLTIISDIINSTVTGNTLKSSILSTWVSDLVALETTNLLIKHICLNLLIKKTFDQQKILIKKVFRLKKDCSTQWLIKKSFDQVSRW